MVGSPDVRRGAVMYTDMTSTRSRSLQSEGPFPQSECGEGDTKQDLHLQHPSKGEFTEIVLHKVRERVRADSQKVCKDMREQPKRGSFGLETLYLSLLA